MAHIFFYVMVRWPGTINKLRIVYLVDYKWTVNTMSCQTIPFHISHCVLSLNLYFIRCFICWCLFCFFNYQFIYNMIFILTAVTLGRDKKYITLLQIHTHTNTILSQIHLNKNKTWFSQATDLSFLELDLVVFGGVQLKRFCATFFSIYGDVDVSTGAGSNAVTCLDVHLILSPCPTLHLILHLEQSDIILNTASSPSSHLNMNIV